MQQRNYIEKTNNGENLPTSCFPKESAKALADHQMCLNSTLITPLV